jgi:hypothetical protein
MLFPVYFLSFLSFLFAQGSQNKSPHHLARTSSFYISAFKTLCLLSPFHFIEGSRESSPPSTVFMITNNKHLLSGFASTASDVLAVADGNLGSIVGVIQGEHRLKNSNNDSFLFAIQSRVQFSHRLYTIIAVREYVSTEYANSAAANCKIPT